MGCLQLRANSHVSGVAVKSYMSAHNPPPRNFSEPEALRRRVALLEEATSKAWSERADLEGRIACLEHGHTTAARTTAQAFEANAMRLTELAVSVAELPLGHVLQDALEQLASMRTMLDAKAERKDQDRLADALGQSCRDLTATLRVCRQDLAILEQSCKGLDHAVNEYSKDVSRLDQACSDLHQAFEKREQDLTDLERQWSRRLWGYRENSPSATRRPRPPSGRTYACPTDSVALPPWKPWPTNGTKLETALVTQQADSGPQRLDSPARRLCDSGLRTGLVPLRTARGNRESWWAEERPPDPIDA